MMRFARLISAVLFAVSVALPVEAQTAGAGANDPLAVLTTEERGRFDAANKEFNAQRYGEALPVFKGLMTAHPENVLLAKYASEAAIDVGDRGFAEATLKPIEAAYPEDWQAAALLARVYAEGGDKAGRDREMERMAELQKQGVTPPRLTQYVVERIPLAGGGSMMLSNSLVPWGNYKVQNYGQVRDAEGRMVMRVTLENSDFDQPQFAKEHPKEAAAGARRYSLDGYRTVTPAGGGQASDTHFTFGFLDGRPSYDEMRADFVAIAEGKKPAMSSRSGLPIPQGKM